MFLPGQPDAAHTLTNMGTRVVAEFENHGTFVNSGTLTMDTLYNSEGFTNICGGTTTYTELGEASKPPVTTTPCTSPTDRDDRINWRYGDLYAVDVGIFCYKST